MTGETPLWMMMVTGPVGSGSSNGIQLLPQLREVKGQREREKAVTQIVLYSLFSALLLTRVFRLVKSSALYRE